MCLSQDVVGHLSADYKRHSVSHYAVQSIETAFLPLLGCLQSVEVSILNDILHFTRVLW